MVSQELRVLLVVAKTVTLVCGGALTALSARAARRTGSRALRALAVGMGLVTVGALAGGLTHQVVGLSLGAGAGVSSVFTALGLTVMTYSLYAETAARNWDRQTGPGSRSSADD